MQWFVTPDRELVTSPIMAGDVAMLAEQLRCCHQFAEMPGAKPCEDHEDCLMRLDRCDKCDTTRMRISGPEKDLAAILQISTGNLNGVPPEPEPGDDNAGKS